MPKICQFELWNGDYIKTTYLALIDGKKVACWPNAGKMCACDGTGRSWRPEDNIQVRKCTFEEHVTACKK